jgi:hypothetical protein
MPLLLRTVKQNRWHKDAAAPFLANDDVPADPLGDLNTSDNLLSVWVLSEDNANLERVVRAVAIGKQNIDHAGYVTFDSKVLEDAGIQVVEEPGTTKDTEANAWHRNLVLSGNKVVALAKGILRDGASGQILRQRLKDLISEGVQQGHLPAEVQAKFEKK